MHKKCSGDHKRMLEHGCVAGMCVLASRAASIHSTSSTEMMLMEGFLERGPHDVETGYGLQALVTPSGMGAEMRSVI